MTEPATIALPIAAVTVLEDRAAITRRGTVAVRAGQQRVIVEGVAPVLADKTLVATCGGARVLDVRCERYLAPWRDPAHDRDALRAERVQLAAARELAAAKSAGARAEAEAFASLVAASLRDLAATAARGKVVERADGQLAELDEREATARARRIHADHDAERLATQLARIDALIAKLEREAGREAARLVIDLAADAAAEVALTASYVVPCAAWRPYHRAVLDRANNRVELQTTACVWQATGEDWDGVELACSLERPSLGVEPPEFADDELAARRKPDHVVVEVRDHEQQTTGLGGGPLEVPGIDDGGLGLVLTAGRASVRADGTPHRVALGGFTAPAQLALVAIPSRSPWVHLRARFANTGATPLLAGPVDLVMASGYVGRGEIAFVAPGEKVNVGFGPDAELRAHRSEERERDEAGLLGGWNVQTVRVAVRISNLGAAARTIDVTERVPMSEVESVDVQVGAADAYLLGDDGGEEITQVTARALDERGLVTWAVDVPAHGRRAVTLEYRIRSQRGVAGV